MKRVMLCLGFIALVGTAAAVKAHDGHKHAKAKTAATAPTKAPAAATDVKKVTLTGEIIDPQCWFTHNGEGPKHADCAVRCAQGGQDLAFLDAQSGELYTLIAVAHGKNPNVGLYDHVGVPVTVRGTSYQRGSNRGLMVEAVDKAR